MVGMSSSFGSIDFQTPHGGPAFQGWRKGFGFGHARGPGGYSGDPTIPSRLRFTPGGDRAFAASSFWRKKHEIGQASGFGIGERPDYGRAQKHAADIAPDTYGDTSRALRHTRKVATRANITIKPRFPSMEEKYRDMSWPQCGPGPSKYNTSVQIGQSSFAASAVAVPAYSMRPNIILQADVRDAMSKPGPDEYNTRVAPGKKSCANHSTLYDTSLGAKIKPHDLAGQLSPGPARYNVRGHLDEYGLWQKIANIQGPPKGYHKQMARRAAEEAGRAGSLGPVTEEQDATDFDDMRRQRGLQRNESSPL